MTYLTTAKIGVAFWVIRLDPATENDINAPVVQVGGPHRSQRAANTAAREICDSTGERLTNSKGKRIY